LLLYPDEWYYNLQGTPTGRISCSSTPISDIKRYTQKQDKLLHYPISDVTRYTHRQDKLLHYPMSDVTRYTHGQDKLILCPDEWWYMGVEGALIPQVCGGR
jgi:hypothetical protein